MAEATTSTPPTEKNVTAALEQPVASYGSFRISDFRSSIASRGIIRNHTYFLTFNPPKVIAGAKGTGVGFKETEMILRADAITLPGQQLMTADAIMRYGFGPSEKMPYNMVYSDIAVSLLLDKAAMQYHYLYLWMQSIVQNNMTRGINGFDEAVNKYTGIKMNSYEVGYKNDYAVDMTIIVYNEDVKTAIECRLLDAYPISISDTPLSWGQENDVMRLQVNFNYRSAFTRFIDPSGIRGLLNSIQDSKPTAEESPLTKPNNLAIQTVVDSGQRYA